MNLSGYLSPQRVAILSAKTKEQAMDEMAGLLASDDIGVSRKELLDAMRHREGLMSTGIGHELGIPHVRMAGLKRAYMAVGVSPTGIQDYESLDGKPVRIIVLIAAPQGQHEVYIRLLAGVTERLKDVAVRQAIADAEDPAQVYASLVGERE
jgi:PTS system nitrogen regulatory IIA component